MLRAQHIFKNYAKHIALEDVSIEVPKAHIYGLLGPNGAGKSSLIRIINRITAPDKGEVYFDGQLLSASHIKRIGYLPEERGLYRKMKVGEEAIYLARLKGVSQQEAKRRLINWFEKFDIMPWWDKKVEELSKGMQQKIQFVCSIIHEPDLLIFDEPFSGFDPVNADLLKREILELKQRGKTIIFSTHNMQSVEEICDDIALINRSRLVLSGKVQEVRSRYKQNKVRIDVDLTDESSRLFVENLDDVEKEFKGNVCSLQMSLQRNETLRDFVITLPKEICLLGVQEELPSMHDIFVSLVGSSQNNQSK